MVQFKLKSIQELSIPEQANLVAGMSHTCTCTCTCRTDSTKKATKNATGNTVNLETKIK